MTGIYAIRILKRVYISRIKVSKEKGSKQKCVDENQRVDNYGAPGGNIDRL